jgi:hypothetical protein
VGLSWFIRCISLEHRTLDCRWVSQLTD